MAMASNYKVAIVVAAVLGVASSAMARESRNRVESLLWGAPDAHWVYGWQERGNQPSYKEEWSDRDYRNRRP
jgi:hypothetical protein